MWPSLQFPPDFVRLTEESLNGKLCYLCSDSTLWQFDLALAMKDKDQAYIAGVLDAVVLLSPCAVNVLFRKVAKSKLCWQFRFGVVLTLDEGLARKKEGCGWSGGVSFF